MSVAIKALIQAKYASNSLTSEYSSPTSHQTIIDKFTATNTDTGAQTVTVHLVPSGGTADSTNIITSAMSLAAGESAELPELKNQVLESGDSIAVIASVASKVVIRASGRDVH